MSGGGRLNVALLFPEKTDFASAAGKCAAAARAGFAMAAALSGGKMEDERTAEELTERDKPERERGVKATGGRG